MRLARLAIWIATAGFVVMLFYPLVRELVVRISAQGESGFP